jgi:hypothetical protein
LIAYQATTLSDTSEGVVLFLNAYVCSDFHEN